MNLFVKGKKVRLDPKRAIGRGGEAEVYDIGNRTALKVFKSETHPDFQASPQAQQAARDRLQEHQYKLRVFPQQLPDRVITPQDLATDQSGQTILGYTMPLIPNAEVLLRYAERSFRQAGIPAQTVVQIFQDLHQTVAQLHQAQVVIGDFNDLNVLVQGTAAYLIDADSFQFQGFPARMYTALFVDPKQCDPQATQPIMIGTHSPASDWYAYTIMLMQCLLFVGPYGGVYKPQDPSQRMPHDARPLHRITVFHPDVKYPKPALPYGILPDELLQHFHRVFEQDLRGQFPTHLLDHLQWTTCTRCGTEHARAVCPSCLQAGLIKQTITVRGKVTCNRYFKTEGVIVFAALQRNQLIWLYYENGKFNREDGSTLMQGNLDPLMRFRLQGKATVIGKGGQMITLQPEQAANRIAVDSFGTLPIFDVNSRCRYWIHNGQLLRDETLAEGSLGSEYIGDVLSGQTLFWVGSDFGFGFYRAGDLDVAFVFDAERRGINDTVQLPAWSGQLIDSTCFFSQDRCWFIWATQDRGRTLHRCAVIQPDSAVIATAQAERGDGSWLGTLRGKCAAGSFLLVATDDGIVRVEPHQGQILLTKEFPDTEPFVDSSCHLFVNQEGLHVIGRQEIRLLKVDSS